MSNDGDRTDPDSPIESSREPDEFDSLVLDDHFIAGGIPEASLADHQRALPARPLQRPRPVQPDPFTSPPSGPGGPYGWTPRGSGREMRSAGLLLGTAALVVLLVVMTGFMHIGPGLGGTGGAVTVLPSASEVAGAGDPAQPYVVGLSALTPIGTCFNVKMPSKFVDAQPCSDQHEYELINLELASGANSAYPADSYWSGIVQDQCNRELQSYLGSASQPATVAAEHFGPSRASWAAGDRTIYCVAHSTPPMVGSLYRAGAAGSTG